VSAQAALPPEVREQDRRIERLLAEAEAATGPVAWPRVEALLTALIDLYGRGLERILSHARASAGERSGELAERLGGDEVVASLLLLHDLHPIPVATRIDRALARLREQLPDAAHLTLASVDDGLATFRVAAGKPPPTPAVVARAVELEAPELEGIRFLDTETPETRARPLGLVPVERLRQGRPPGPSRGAP
jgi:hypothetical protein